MQGIFWDVLICILTYPFQILASDKSSLVLRTFVFVFMGTIIFFLELELQKHIGLIRRVEFILLNPFIKDISKFLLAVLH